MQRKETPTTSQHGFSVLWEIFSIIVVKKCNLHTIIHFLHPGKSCCVIYMYICTLPTFTHNPSVDSMQLNKGVGHMCMLVFVSGMASCQYAAIAIAGQITKNMGFGNTGAITGTPIRIEPQAVIYKIVCHY